jgi:uncharacterized protein YdhG (YjbR/CyaY superfamily)
MKKTRSKARESAARGSSAKSKTTPKSVEDYLAHVEEPARSTLKKLRAAIRSALPPEASEGISYGIPTFKCGGPVIWYAAFSKHCSLFPGASVIDRLKDELKDLPTSKGTIQFPVDKPLSAALVKKIVKARLAEKERNKS